MTTDTATAKQSYEKWHTRYPVDSDCDTPWHRWTQARLDAATHLDNRDVLEIGCGRGGFARWLGRMSHPRVVVAADFSETAVCMGRAFADAQPSPAVDWQTADILQLPFRDASFDTVFSFETIEHVADPGTAAQELARVLKPGGVLFLTTPNYLSVTGLYRLYLRLTGRRYTEEGQPINNFVMLPRVIRWVTHAGLRIEEASSFGHYRLRPGRVPQLTALQLKPRTLTRWFGLHSLIIARKPVS
jgi:ubiquinone/menaquinone biosynthesis C-methylase UbiE